MEKRTHLYRMNRLMKYKEMEAFSAQKNAGSRGAYFDLLDEFTSSAPALITGMTVPAGEKDLEEFLKRIYNLQRLLLAIGATALLWEAEKTAESARAGEKFKCEDKTRVLCERVKILCSKIDEARVESGGGDTVAISSSDTSIVAVAPGENWPKAPIKPEMFRELCNQLENFETDDAMTLLRSLRGFTYNAAIDSALVAIHNALLRFDHDEAMTQCDRLLELANEAKNGAEKAAKKKILAVDDVPDVLNTVKSVLSEHYAVYGVTNHMAALKFLTNNSADLILLDIEMPDMDGFELLGIIRRIKAYETTPAIFLTGSVTVENIVKSRSAGGNDFIKKPIDAQVLLSKIGRQFA